jgi:hypothetical protein
MCLNALVFNKESDEYWLEAKAFEIRGQAIFSLLNRYLRMYKHTLAPIFIYVYTFTCLCLQKIFLSHKFT